MDPTVLYITGWCRSGSTVLGNALAEVPGVFHCGELRFLWRNGVLRTGSNSRCGCGADLDACPVWSAVLTAVTPPGRDPRRHAEEVVRDQEHWRTRHTGRALRASGTGLWPPTLAATYRAISDVTGAQVVVDSSKYASDAALASRAALQVPNVHLVRDPRAVAHSWLTPKDYTGRRGPISSTWYWLGFNYAGRRVADTAPAASMLLRYEDLTARPRESVGAVLDLIGRAAQNPVAADGSVDLGPNHTVTGNPNRFEHGRVTLREDLRWRERLARHHQVAVSVLAAPQLHRYGYRLGG